MICDLLLSEAKIPHVLIFIFSTHFKIPSASNCLASNKKDAKMPQLLYICFEL